MKDDRLLESGSDKSITYLIVEDLGSVFVPDTQDIFTTPNSNLFNGNQELSLEGTNLERVKSTQENTNLATSDNILNEIKNFKKFQAYVESKLGLLEDAIISGNMTSTEISNENISRFIVDILKDRISSLENFIFRIPNKATTIIKFKQLADEKQ